MSDWNDHRTAAEAAALEAMTDLAAACGELRAAVAADPKVQAGTVARLDLQRRFAWCRVNDALGYAEACLGWDSQPRDPLFAHSEATQRLYAEYHSGGVALGAGPQLEAARNKMMRAASAAERALEKLGLVYDERLCAPSFFPDIIGPLDRMRELHQTVSGPLARKAAHSRPRHSSMSRRLTGRMRTGRS